MVILTVVYAPLTILFLPLPYRWRYNFAASWCTVNLHWLRITCGIDYQVVGRHNIPATATVVLSKHESTFETLALNELFRPQVWVLKRELTWVPFFGWGISTLRPISIDRDAGRNAVSQVIEQGRQRLQSGSWVVVFPEGTRVPAGYRGRYRMGGAKLAEATGLPVVPVAHNAGDFWPRRTFLKRPGTVTIIIGPIIETPGLSAADINRRAEDWIEGTLEELRGAPQIPLF